MTTVNLGFGTTRIISERVNGTKRVRISTGKPKATVGADSDTPTPPHKKDIVLQLHNAEGADVLVRAILALYPKINPYYVHCA